MAPPGGGCRRAARTGVAVLGPVVAVGLTGRRPASASVSACANIGGMSNAAELLVEARGRAALGQAELARRAGVPRSVLNAYERGRREPGVDSLLRLLAAAGFELGLVPVSGTVDAHRAARVLSDVLDLADALPFRRDKALRGPSLLRRTR